ncbi:hypothetical protein CLU79DRAFT_883159 [Phycomyces nitens]|nr:hypothetical protein CLU79DRAFT_883159 [Phycomyces nitens]
MHIGLLSQDRLYFDPLKPVILRGPPTDDSSTVFMGNVVLSLSKARKLSKITVQFKSVANTNWPEGIGSRATRLYHKKTLNEETINVLGSVMDDKDIMSLPVGTHRFPFTFVVPNSIAETIEDIYGQVSHTIEAHASGPGLQLLNNLHTLKPVLVLRTYMSNSILTNNSLQDLSRTFEKQLDIADVQAIVENTAYSSGELLHLRLTIQPHKKNVRLEHIDVSIEETRRYTVIQMDALRTGTDNFGLEFLHATRLLDGESVAVDTDELKSVFVKHGRPLEVNDTLVYRITLASPSCSRQIRHTTHYKDILFRHRINIKINLSHSNGSVSAPVSRTPSSQNLPTLANSQISLHQPSLPTNNPQSSHSTPVNNGQQPNWHNMLSKLRKSRLDKDVEYAQRQQYPIVFESLIGVFDCRLKEDYGQLPSYADLGISTNNIPLAVDSKSSNHTNHAKTARNLKIKMDQAKPSVPAPHLCACYFKFHEQLRLASETPVLSAPTIGNSLELEPPSNPPPEYVENTLDGLNALCVHNKS